MSYQQQKRNNGVTMLNQLPDLDDVAINDDTRIHDNQHHSELPPGLEHNYGKIIRGNHRMNPASGMINGPPNYYENTEHYGIETHVPSYSPPLYMTYNCVDIARHIQDCPICSKFYNNDKTVYIIAIVALSIVCLLLLKRVLNV